MGLASVLLVLSPFTAVNTPYPSTAYLKGYLEAKGVRAGQADLGIETILTLFSTQGLGSYSPRSSDGKVNIRLKSGGCWLISNGISTR